jgi:hypothetical protein
MPHDLFHYTTLALALLMPLTPWIVGGALFIWAVKKFSS